MDSDRVDAWRAADRLFGEWLDQPQAQRSAWLARQCLAAAVRAALERLIAEHSTADGLPSSLDHGDAACAPTVVCNALSGRRIGDWILLEEIGRGGMSVVYRARRCDVDFEQTAAVKLLSMAALGSQGLGRFEQERRVLARLRHPHIAALIDGGVSDDGSAFLVMSLVEGRDLARYSREQDLDWRDRVRLVEQVCDAVAHAHQNLLVHRDLKPSNILVTDEGVPVLLDFGIAKLLDSEDDATRTGLRPMTPGYAAPEQFAGGPITTATDVYALGVILRDLCAGDTALPSDLANIIAMATRPEPERRYPDARALGEDLHRLLSGHVVRATPDSAGYRLRSFVRRRSGWVIAASAVLVVLVAGLVATRWQAQRAAMEAREAMRQSERAEAARSFLFALFEAGNREQTNGEDLRVSALVERGTARLPEFAERPELHAEMASLLGRIDTTLGKYTQAHTLLDAAAQSAARSGDARLLAQVRLGLATLANAEGESAKAAELFDEAIALRERDGQGDPGFRVAALSGWGYAMQNSGRSADAIGRIAAELGKDGSAYTPGQRGELLLNQAGLTVDPHQKLALVSDARTQYAKERIAPTAEFELEAMFGAAYARIGEPGQSVTHLRRAIGLADRLYPGSTRQRARIYNNFGASSNAANHPAEANAAFAVAEQIYRDLGDSHSPAFAALLHNRGLLLRDLGDSARGLALLEQALDLASQQFGANDHRTGLALLHTAYVRADNSPDPRADEEWLRASAIARAAAKPRQIYDLLLTGTQIALDLGRTDEAQARFDEAEALLARESLSLSTVQDLLRQTRLGILQSLQGHAQAASEAFGRARALAQVGEDAPLPQWWRVERAIAEDAARNKDPAQARVHHARALGALLELGATADASSVVALRQRLQRQSVPAAQ
jgi:eukaryotic-like serine/threonine-protein kinase